ncbi:MAG: succinyl-diaminopimelate desuccinylase [Gammaproteobacteria bacterium]|nr:succinyl-diaminopimelate desuccinylase [Gammaproteobacteria bacterium]
MADSATVQLASELIRRPSVTPDDAGCQALIAERLAASGFSARRINVGEVSNLWLERGEGAPLVVLAGHTDVVPPGPQEAWDSPPFEPAIRDQRLYGRGAADMKGSLAAFVTASEIFVQRHATHAGSLAMLLTSDEEGPAVDGTARVLETLAQEGRKIDYCIVGEPTAEKATGDVIKNGRRGSLTGALTVRGIQGHVAYPEQVRNPVHELAPALARLVQTTWDAGNADFPPTSFQVSNLSAGTGAENVVPGELRMQFNFRFSTQSTAEQLQARVDEILSLAGLDYAIDWRLSAQPFLTPAGRLVDTVGEAIRTVTGRAPRLSTTGGTSDGRFLARTGAEVIELGPPNSSIHQINEWVGLDDLEQLGSIYTRSLEGLLLS